MKKKAENYRWGENNETRRIQRAKCWLQIDTNF